MIHARSTAALLVALTAATLVSGCAGPADKPGPASSFSETSATTAAVTPDTSASVAGSSSVPARPRSSSGLSPAELARIRAQLDAMQKEIDSLQMPSDDDFNSAAGDLY